MKFLSETITLALTFSKAIGFNRLNVFLSLPGISFKQKLIYIVYNADFLLAPFGS